MMADEKQKIFFRRKKKEKEWKYTSHHSPGGELPWNQVEIKSKSSQGWKLKAESSSYTYPTNERKERKAPKVPPSPKKRAGSCFFAIV